MLRMSLQTVRQSLLWSCLPYFLMAVIASLLLTFRILKRHMGRFYSRKKWYLFSKQLWPMHLYSGIIWGTIVTYLGRIEHKYII